MKLNTLKVTNQTDNNSQETKNIIFQSDENDEWIVKGVKTVQEATELIAVGFEYVTEIEGFKLFRKRK